MDTDEGGDKDNKPEKSLPEVMTVKTEADRTEVKIEPSELKDRSIEVDSPRR